MAAVAAVIGGEVRAQVAPSAGGEDAARTLEDALQRGREQRAARTLAAVKQGGRAAWLAWQQRQAGEVA